MINDKPEDELAPKSVAKSIGQTRTEQLLAKLCDGTFLKLWAYPNPFKDDGKELCDLIAIFENHVFLFFDRESKKFTDSDKDILLQWQRWEKEVIQKQIATAKGAEGYIRNKKGKVFLDTKQENVLPIDIPFENLQIHKIIVAHGAEDACKNFSSDNVFGSLGISYGAPEVDKEVTPFIVNLNKDDLIHVLDSVNLEIILGELDTFYDFASYIEAKEAAIRHFDVLIYCGEEDLLAHYFQNFDEANGKHFIGVKDKTVNGLWIAEGEWLQFSKSKQYRLKKEADRESYLWDDLLQYTSQNALDGTLVGENRDIFNLPSAIREMAKEPRFIRRVFSANMHRAFGAFPDEMRDKFSRYLSFFQSFYPGVGYVLLQFHAPEEPDYDGKVRPLRTAMLQVACGVTKLKHPELEKVIGIALDPPKFRKGGSEDFMLFDCSNWTKEEAERYAKDNETLQFFESPHRTVRKLTTNEFPRDGEATGRRRTISRNSKCPCGSGRKYKNCCG